MAKTLFTFRYGIPAVLVLLGLGGMIFMDWPEGAEDKPKAKRRWHLPEGVMTLEDEERRAREREV